MMRSCTCTSDGGVNRFGSTPRKVARQTNYYSFKQPVSAFVYLKAQRDGLGISSHWIYKWLPHSSNIWDAAFHSSSKPKCFVMRIVARKTALVTVWITSTIAPSE